MMVSFKLLCSTHYIGGPDKTFLVAIKLVDGIPALEDMSNELKVKKAKAEALAFNNNNQTSLKSNAADAEAKTMTRKADNLSLIDKSVGAFQPGFLLSGSASRSTPSSIKNDRSKPSSESKCSSTKSKDDSVPTAADDASLPFLKSDPDANLRFSQVQDSLRNGLNGLTPQGESESNAGFLMWMASILNNFDGIIDYLTPDLLRRMEQSPHLLQLFSKPEFQHAIQLLSTEPEKALEKYGKNKDFMQALKEWMTIMGDGLSKMPSSSKTSPQATGDSRQPTAIEKLAILTPSSATLTTRQAPKISTLPTTEETMLMDKVMNDLDAVHCQRRFMANVAILYT